MEDTLIELLSSFGYPVYRQGSLSEGDKYPDSFFTFWNSDSPDHSHFDNDNYGTDWAFSVYFYSVDPDLVYQTISDARILLKQNHWIVPSKGFDVDSDEPSHIGRGLAVLFLEV
jgi:hypothetical protein